MTRNTNMPDITSENTERREYFRLSETILMGYTRHEQRLNSSEEIGDSSGLEIIEEFASMTRQFKVSLARINQRLPEVTACFKLLDAKLNLLAENVYNQQDKTPLKRQKANLSGSGISFSIDEEIPMGEMIELTLVLPPELHILTIKAQVVKCIANNSDYILSVKFEDLNEQTQDMIVRHVMQSQSNLLRKDKL